MVACTLWSWLLQTPTRGERAEKGLRLGILRQQRFVSCWMLCGCFMLCVWEAPPTSDSLVISFARLTLSNFSCENSTSHKTNFFSAKVKTQFSTLGPNSYFLIRCFPCTLLAGEYYRYSPNRCFSQKKLTNVIARWRAQNHSGLTHQTQHGFATCMQYVW